jgi:hypothetical protein
VDAKTKESTRKTDEKLDGRYKPMNERNLNEGQWEDRKQWSLGVGQRKKRHSETDIYIYEEQTEVRERLLSFCAECFVLQFII